MTAIKEHRTYDQFQRALKSTSRPGTSQPISGTASNVSGDGIRSTSSCASLPATPEDPSATVQLVQSTPQLKTLKQTFQLPSEHIEGMTLVRIDAPWVASDLLKLKGLEFNESSMKACAIKCAKPFKFKSSHKYQFFKWIASTQTIQFSKFRKSQWSLRKFQIAVGAREFLLVLKRHWFCEQVKCNSKP